MNIFETSITHWKNNAKAALTMSFDGGYKKTYELTTDAFLKYKMKGTYYIVTDYIGGNLIGFPVATWSEWKRASQQGMEIASHTVSHPKLAIPNEVTKVVVSSLHKKKIPSLKGIMNFIYKKIVVHKTNRSVGLKVMKNEVIHSKDIIDTKINQRTLSFAYPHGLYSTALKRVVKNAGYLSARSTDIGYNLLNSIDFYALKCQIWDVSVNADIANKWVDVAIEKGAWLIELYHVMSETRSTEYNFHTIFSDFAAHLAYINAQNIWADTQLNIVKYIRERDATRINILSQTNKKIILAAENDMDPILYDQALTLQTRVPSTWFKVKIVQCEDVQIVAPIKIKGEYYIYYNIRSNMGEVILTPVEAGSSK